MRIYIAGPYGKHSLSVEQREANVKVAIESTRELIKLGHHPYVPHLSHYIHEGWEDSPDEKSWKKSDLVWLKVCDAILMVGDFESSPGALNEREEAQKLGLKVFYSIQQLVKEP